MSAERIPPQGLADAQRKIRLLMAELDETLGSVHRLERIGEHGIARGLIEEQRARLDTFVSDVARDVAAPARTSRRRRRVLVALAAAMMAMTGVAAFAAMRTSAPAADLGAQLQRVEHIKDPARRLSQLETVYASAYKRGAATVDFRRAVAAAATKTRGDFRKGHPNPILAQQAGVLATTASNGDPPSAPQPPQSSGESPLQTVEKNVLGAR